LRKIKKIKIKILLILTLTFILNFLRYKSCLLNPQTEGICIEKSDISADVNFCKNFLPDNICIPYTHVKTNYYKIFKKEIWPEWNANAIDKNIQETAVIFLEDELSKEMIGSADMVLINNPSCLNSYLNYICKINFIPCNKESKF